MSRIILAEIAPTLAAALDGPFDIVAARYLTRKLDHEEIPPGPKLETFLKGVLDKPENLHKVHEIEQQFRLEMEKLNVDMFSLEQRGRKGAGRDDQNVRPQVMLSITFIVGYFIFLAGLFVAEVSPDFNPGMYQLASGEWVPQSESLIDLFQVLLGVLTAGVSQVLNFWFGSLFGSRSKSA